MFLIVASVAELIVSLANHTANQHGVRICSLSSAPGLESVLGQSKMSATLIEKHNIFCFVEPQYIRP